MQSNKLKRVVLKEEMVAVTGGAVSGLILNQMVYWTEILNSSDQELQKQIEEFQKLGLEHKVRGLEKQLRNGWFWKSAQELSEELMGISSRGTIDRKLKELCSANFIETRKNPNNKMDKTNHYRVNMGFLRQELKKLGYTLDGYAIPEDEKSKDKNVAETLIPPIAQNEQSNAHNEQWNAQNKQSTAHSEQTIPEITSETSSKTTSRESIYRNEIENLDIGKLSKSVLKDSIDRLILFDIKLLEIELLYKNSELTDKHFANVLDNVLKSEIKKSFKRKMEVSIDTFIENANKKPSLQRKGRTEVVPESLNAVEEPEEKKALSYLEGVFKDESPEVSFEKWIIEKAQQLNSGRDYIDLSEKLMDIERLAIQKKIQDMRQSG